MATEPLDGMGSDPALPSDDTVQVAMAIPLPPMPFTDVRPPPAAPKNKLHPDATNWNEPDEVPEIPVGPALDEPLDRVATFAPGQDNIEAAMNDLAEDMDLTVSTRVSDDDGPADKQILIRATETDRERWKRAAEKAEMSLSALIRDTMNIKVTDILDCSHPMSHRTKYPWAEFCTKCDVRLSG
tara:strand:+ start:6379 stop:6930 length:552 start_codon:yes stop_codon:yes gene_type:complete